MDAPESEETMNDNNGAVIIKDSAGPFMETLREQAEALPPPEPYGPAMVAALNNVLDDAPLKERFKVTLKAPYAKTNLLARQNTNIIYVYGEETDDVIVTTADIDVDQILEIERAGFFDPKTNTIVDDPEVSSIDDRQISA